MATWRLLPDLAGFESFPRRRWSRLRRSHQGGAPCRSSQASLGAQDATTERSLSGTPLGGIRVRSMSCERGCGPWRGGMLIGYQLRRLPGLVRRSSCPLLVGYARVSTHDQDLTAQRDALAALGVRVASTYVDHGLTGTNRDRPGLREALAACRSGDTLVVTKLDRLARSLPDARDISPRARSSSASADRCTIRPTRWGGCCSTCRRWSPSLSLTPSGCEPRRGCASPRPTATCSAGRPSSTRARRRISSFCTVLGSTAPPSSATCPASGARPCSESSSATAGAASARALGIREPRCDRGTATSRRDILRQRGSAAADSRSRGVHVR